ncbi:MAG: GvpL/GvpF family gas vesicle protein [Candidatus Bipolaricaulia bacterium]
MYQNQNDREHAYYVYAVAQSQDSREPGPLPAEGIVPQVSVSTLTYRDLLAVVSPVPLAEFGPLALEDHLQDADWAQARVLAHQQVLAALLDGYTLVPFKFCTLYHSWVRVREMLAWHYEALNQALQRLKGATEWGVKLYCDRRALMEWVRKDSGVLQSQREAIAQASAGVGYFLRKKLEQEAEEEVERVMDVCVNESHWHLADCAREAVTNPVQPPTVHGHKAEMVLNSAYLVDEIDLEAFRRTLAILERSYAPQFRYELTGPWPPYNFATLELEEVTDESSPVE